MTKEQRRALRQLSMKLKTRLDVYRSEGGNVRVICRSDPREFFVRPGGTIEKVRSSRYDLPRSA